MKLIDLSWNDLRETSGVLANWVVSHTDQRQKMLVVGIAHGGTYIGQAVQEVLQGYGYDVRYVDILCQRPGSGIKKNRILKKIIRILPAKITHLIRMGELQMMHFWSHSAKRNDRTVTVADRPLFEACAEKAETIVIVDDSIDTGATMSAVHDYISKLYSGNRIILSLTTTTDNPQVHPDFSVYTQTIVRTPWSLDYKD
jgi:hypoxanthine phosphoribosyltransferase